MVAVDVDAARLDLARDLGATHVIDVRDTADLSTALRGVTPRGLDIVLETSGRAENLTAAVDSLAPRGRVGIVTFEQGAGGGVTSAQLALGRSVHGIAQGDAVSPLLLTTLADLWRAGGFPVDRLVTSYDSDDINQAFDDAAAGRVLKAVLRFPC
ncbi:zinc-binding dehydrogenase [Streptomyces sp. NPDC005774]|uniref:zinc-binding dehydrogenase n=1 Tax=Streptomyces sp. NPDC005774 TaxID=3364728 RepID=UPI003677EA7D